MIPPLLDAVVRCRRGDMQIDVPITVAAGSVTAVVGPNGAGKSTLLHALAGLVRLVEGHVHVGGVRLSDPAAAVHVPAESRPVGLVFQQHLLFPAMSALDNVAFGLRARGTGKREARRAAKQLLDAAGLSHRADARPAQLSGGQAQRVALARALAVDPQVLLLDEPFAALDVGARSQLRTEMQAQSSSFRGATVLVTHDPLDALIVADHVVVMEAGRLVQSGTPAELARHPRTEYVAQLAGLNLLRGTARGGSAAVRTATGSTVDIALAAAHEGDVLIAIRPTSIAVHLVQPSGSPRNVWQATVTSVELHGGLVRLATAGGLDVMVDVTTESAAQLRLVPGTAVWLSVKATEVTAYPA